MKLKKLVNDWENIAYWEGEQSKMLANKCGSFMGFGEVVTGQPQEEFAIFTLI